MNIIFRIVKTLLVLISFFSIGTVKAESNELSAPVLHFGELPAYPGLALQLKHDSNISRVPDTSPNKHSSSVAVLSPSVMLQADKDVYVYSLSYIADIGRYNNSSADNYVDQTFLGVAEIGLSTSLTLLIKPKYLISHDERGATFGAFTVEPNKWTSRGVSGSLAYGGDEARGKALLDVGYSDQQYQNNRTLTMAYDKSQVNVGGTYYLRVQPKTWLLLHAKQTDISYKLVNSPLSSREERFMMGLKWEATAQSSGEVKIGQLQKKFDSTYATINSITWEGDVSWSPVTFVKVDLLSSKFSNETTLLGSSTILTGDTGADVAYDLNDRVTLHVTGYQVKEDFVGASRVDKTNSFGFKAEYKFRSWLLVGAEYSNSAKTSSTSANEYKRNILMFNMHSML